MIAARWDTPKTRVDRKPNMQDPLVLDASGARPVHGQARGWELKRLVLLC